jgi:hypothetical protein
VVGRDIFYFVHNHSDSTKKFSETEIINMPEFFIEHTFAMLSGRVFQQTVSIPMRTNCTPSLPDLFFYSYDVDFIQGLHKKKRKEASPIL